jgi:hypothetical protein
MPRHKDPDHMTAEEEIRSVLDWARRTGHLNIAAALHRALSKWPVTAAQEKIRRGHDAKIHAAKHAIAKWAEDHERPGNGGTMTLALLELGIERHLEHFPDEKSATDLVQGVLRKVLQRRRGPMQ